MCSQNPDRVTVESYSILWFILDDLSDYNYKTSNLYQPTGVNLVERPPVAPINQKELNHYWITPSSPYEQKVLFSSYFFLPFLGSITVFTVLEALNASV